ncbi:hypothetical protein SAY87_001374 [Trapa incisa]|uniref:Uncharacterized protein n=1 Tax=Trapa incisa TaxID=236973 RepID=A0AAN7GNG3_9MYRT|nr:hypothetical protein SAY87_001374 [Trapa incisa]
MAEAIEVGRASLVVSSNHAISARSVVSVFLKRCESLMLKPVEIRQALVWSKSGFHGKRIDADKATSRVFSVKSQLIQGNLGLVNALKWWGKGLQMNMKEVTGAEDLVESLISARDKLVVVGSPGKVCSFSCTNAMIKKFKDALDKNTPDRCSFGPSPSTKAWKIRQPSFLPRTQAYTCTFLQQM